MGFNRWHIVMMVLALLFIGASIYFPLACYDMLPDKYPTHFNFFGEPDAWSRKNTSSLLAGPLILAATTLIMFPVAWWMARVSDPRKIINGPKEKIKNMPLERAEKIRQISIFHLLLIMLLTALLVLVISVESVVVAMGRQPAMGPGVPIITALLIGDSIYLTVRLLRLVYKK